MSFETDAPIRTLCEVCEKYVETEGFGIPAWVMDANHEVFHARCRPDLCEHENTLTYDWQSTDSDSTIYKMRCRDCGYEFTDEMAGSYERGVENDAEC